jgi:hypothetical protein
MEYSLAARLHILAPDDMDFRRFLYFYDSVQKDIAEENKRVEKEKQQHRKRTS